MLTGLHAGRGIAALMVAGFHLHLIMVSHGYSGLPIAGSFHAGVQFFFVLSGFLIARVHQGDQGRPSALPRYLFKRAVRVYPAYWVALSAAVVGLAVLGLPTPGLVTSALLVPTEGPPLLTVAWSLRHELLFYLLFGAVILNRSLGRLVLTAWLIGCVMWLPLYGSGLPADFLFAPVNLGFGLGLAAERLTRGGEVAPTWLLAAGGALIFCVGAVYEAVSGVVATPLSGLAFSGAGFLLVMAGAQIRSPMPRPLMLAGDASYSIYLVHLPIAAITARLLAPADLPGWIFAGVVGLVMLRAGLLFYWTVERPLLTLGRQQFGRPQLRQQRVEVGH